MGSGEPPTCAILHFAKAKYSHRKRSSPLPSHRLGIHPSVALSNDKEFRSLRRATADLGGSGKPLKRLERNFQIGFATKSPINRKLQNK